MKRTWVVVLGVTAALLTAPPAGAIRNGLTLIISRGSDGEIAVYPPGTGSGNPSIDTGGRWTVFTSTATNLGPVTGGVENIFLRDRDSDPGETCPYEGDGAPDGSGPGEQHTMLITVGHDGSPADGPSDNASFAGGSQYVVFDSAATNLVPDDTNGKRDVFIFDRDADGDGCFDEDGPGATIIRRVSRTSTGGEANGDSFAPDAPVYNLSIAYASDATNLVPGDTNSFTDVFWRSMDFDGDGRLDDTVLPGSLERVSASGPVQGDGPSYAPSIDAGYRIAFVSEAATLDSRDQNACPDALGSGAYTQVTRRAAPLAGLEAGHCPDVYLFDVSGPERRLVLVSRLQDGSSPDAPSGQPALARYGNDGRIAFASVAADLVSGTADLNGTADTFLSRPTLNEGAAAAGRAIELLSATAAGTTGDGPSLEPELSADGSVAAFRSEASDLVDPLLDGDADTNGVADVFVRDVFGRYTERVSIAQNGAESTAASATPSLSEDGRYVAFVSEAPLVLPDGAGPDVYVHDRAACLSGPQEDGPVSRPVHDELERPDPISDANDVLSAIGPPAPASIDDVLTPLNDAVYENADPSVEPARAATGYAFPAPSELVPRSRYDEPIPTLERTLARGAPVLHGLNCSAIVPVENGGLPALP